MMSNQNEWKTFLKAKGSVLLLFAVAIIGGTLYAIYLKQNHALDMDYIQNYLVDSKSDEGIVFESSLITFITYFKKYAIIWFLGIVSFTGPIAIVGALVNIFGYGFSVAALYLVYGTSGLLMAGQLFMIQGIVFAVLLLELINFIMRKNDISISGASGNYGICLLSGGLGCALITGWEMVLNL